MAGAHLSSMTMWPSARPRCVCWTAGGSKVARRRTSPQPCELIDGGFAPDVILADLRLAEVIDGIRAVERLRARLRRAVPALLISGDTGARELARVKESGLLLLTKPVAPARLRSALHALLPPVPER